MDREDKLGVTFQAVRTHLGVETQRQWSERAIARTTPALLGPFSLVTPLSLVTPFAHEPLTGSSASLRQAAWYTTTTPTFSDALALVRRRLWTQATFPTSSCDGKSEKVLRAVLDHWADLRCYAA